MLNVKLRKCKDLSKSSCSSPHHLFSWRIKNNLLQETFQVTNLDDTLRRMWTAFDPMVPDEKMKVQLFFKLYNVYVNRTRYYKQNIASTAVTSDDYLFNKMMSN